MRVWVVLVMGNPQVTQPLPVPTLTGMGMVWYGYGYRWVTWVQKPAWVNTVGLRQPHHSPSPPHEQWLVAVVGGATWWWGQSLSLLFHFVLFDLHLQSTL
jgi:hypothetical protein